MAHFAQKTYVQGAQGGAYRAEDRVQEAEDCNEMDDLRLSCMGLDARFAV